MRKPLSLLSILILAAQLLASQAFAWGGQAPQSGWSAWNEPVHAVGELAHRAKALAERADCETLEWVGVAERSSELRPDAWMIQAELSTIDAYDGLIGGVSQAHQLVDAYRAEIRAAVNTRLAWCRAEALEHGVEHLEHGVEHIR